MTEKTIKQLLDEQHRASQRVKAQSKKIALHKRLRAKFEGVRAQRHKDVVAARKAARANKGPAAALKWALAQAGTVETPYGSNRGPKVSAWQQVFGIDGSPWCGAFVGNALKAAGVPVTNRIVYVPYIVQDGKDGANGMLKTVPVSEARVGDLICFDWDRNGVYDHVGMIRENYNGSGILKTVEGNTSSDNNGSQSNGGGVFLRDRPISSAAITIVRPRY